MYDVIVVGGGIGGTGVAALLAKQGRKVLLLEQHDKVGGKCASHEKDGFMVPDFFHAFSRGSKGNCSLISRMVGEEITWGAKINGLPLYFNGQWINLIVGEGLRRPPRLQGLKLPPKDVLDVAKLMVMDTLPKLLTKRGQDELDGTDLRSWLSKRTDNAALHALVAYCFPAYYGVPYWEASVGETLRILWDLWRSRVISYPMEGCSAIPEAFLKGFKKYGGEFKQGKVRRIVVSEGRAKGVELEGGELLEAPLVISNAGIRKTVLDLVGEEHFDKGYVDYVRNLKISCTTLMMHIALSKKIIDVPGGVTVPSEDPVKYFKQLERGDIPEEPTIWSIIPSNVTPKVAPAGKQLLCLAVPVPYRDDADYWKKWADRLLVAGEKLFPGISEYMIWKEVATGDLVKKIDDLGVGFPVAQTNWQVGANRPSMISPINGLCYVGSDVGKRAIGVDLAAESALRCAEIIGNKLGPVG